MYKRDTCISVFIATLFTIAVYSTNNCGNNQGIQQPMNK
jgi:hypothetical protein